MWYVYVLECRNKSLYTGVTTDLVRRVAEHKKGNGARYTKAFGAKQILFSEEWPSRSAALKREAQIKSWKRLRKQELIRSKRQ